MSWFWQPLYPSVTIAAATMTGAGSVSGTFTDGSLDRADLTGSSSVSGSLSSSTRASSAMTGAGSPSGTFTGGATDRADLTGAGAVSGTFGTGTGAKAKNLQGYNDGSEVRRRLQQKKEQRERQEAEQRRSLESLAKRMFEGYEPVRDPPSPQVVLRVVSASVSPATPEWMPQFGFAGASVVSASAGTFDGFVVEPAVGVFGGATVVVASVEDSSPEPNHIFSGTSVMFPTMDVVRQLDLTIGALQSERATADAQAAEERRQIDLTLSALVARHDVLEQAFDAKLQALEQRHVGDVLEQEQRHRDALLALQHRYDAERAADQAAMARAVEAVVLRVVPPREHVGGVAGDPVKDVLIQEPGGWSVYSGTKRIGGPYTKRAIARKFYPNAFDTYAPPPGPGTAKGHPAPPDPDPASVSIALPVEKAASPDPNTRPTPPSGRSDARPRMRLPRQLPPTRHEEDYAKALIRMVKRLRAPYAALIRAIPAALAREDGARADAVDLRSLLARAGAEARRIISQPQVERLARKIAGQTSSFQARQLRRQVRAATTVDPVFKDRKLKARADAFARENAALIKRIPADLHENVAALVQDAVARGRLAGGRGRNPDSLRRDIEQRFGISERHARVIARDQVTKFYAAVNHDRQRELGVKRFTWRSVGDERVRDEHDDLDGETYSYDDPPVVDGEAILPGDAVQCRCWAEPSLDDLLEGQDDDSDEDGDQDE